MLNHFQCCWNQDAFWNSSENLIRLYPHLPKVVFTSIVPFIIADIFKSCNYSNCGNNCFGLNTKNFWVNPHGYQREVFFFFFFNLTDQGNWVPDIGDKWCHSMWNLGLIPECKPMPTNWGRNGQRASQCAGRDSVVAGSALLEAGPVLGESTGNFSNYNHT